MAVTCPKCKASVNDGLFYCPYCSRFLGDVPAQKQTGKKNIWEDDANKQPAAPAGGAVRPASQAAWYILCRSCGRKTILKDPKNCPLACGFCGFDFDSFQDQPRQDLPGMDARNRDHSPARQVPPQAPVQMPGQKKAGPMSRKAVTDTSVLRLQSLTIPQDLLPSDKQANVIGTNGTLSPAFFRSFQGVSATHCVVYHDPAGWYIRFFDKNSQYNGRWVDVGDQMPLRNGDFITLGSSCVLQVFIDHIQGR